MSNCADIWLEIVKGLPTALVALLIGVPTVYVAFRQKAIAAEQKRIAQAKLNLDLFERRLKVFEETWSAASAALRSDGPTRAPAAMTNLYPEASFLFEPDVEAYMHEVARKMTELAGIRQMTVQNGDVLPPDKIDEHYKLEAWLFEAATTGVRSRFQPYLDFSKWREAQQGGST